MLEEWQYSAEVLISHFRCVLRGQSPFSQDTDESADNIAQMDLDPESILYLNKMKSLVGSRSESSLYANIAFYDLITHKTKFTEPEFGKLRETDSFKLDRPFVWLSQLFLGD
jgi:hypothetical protein